MLFSINSNIGYLQLVIRSSNIDITYMALMNHDKLGK